MAPNALRPSRSLEASNAVVDIAGFNGRAARSTYEHANRPTAVGFYVRPLTYGAPFTVRLLVIDDRGQWPSFVGGGQHAF